MPQVLIVSNRLPISVKKDDGVLNFYPSIGGLATGLSSYVDDRRNRWIGWPGIASEELTSGQKQEIVHELAKHNCTPVFLNRRQIDNFYGGYSNTVLWPMFHNLRYKNTANATRHKWWQAYRDVNKKFAETVLNLSESGSRIWIHDYQLMLVPELVRAGRTDIISGFFLHIPFPDNKTLSRLTERKQLINGMLGAEVIGFHTPGYVDNFLEACRVNNIGTVVNKEIVLPKRSVRVADFPMGIDYEKYATAIRSKTVKNAVRRYRQLYKKRKIIVSVDRLDPSKGLVERLKAYATLLDRYPKLHGRIVFIMVAAPSRTDLPAYQRLAKQLQILVNNINETYGSNKWQPVDYINSTQPFEEVTALFQIADIAFIAPLRDGMNLAAKEFVASKRRSGVLILSETAGASNELPDALLVNPKQPETLVVALHQALIMHKRELRLRLRRMQQQLADNTVHEWAKKFVASLNTTVPSNVRTKYLKEKLLLHLVNDYRRAGKRLLLLDYDGSMVPFTENFALAEPPKSLLDLLETLCANDSNDVVLISGRSKRDLKKWFGHIHINLIAEHGAAYKMVNDKSWQTIEKVDNAWKQVLQPILEKYAALTPGARIEAKPHSIVWHYRAAPAYYSQKYAVILKRVLKPLLKKYGLEIVQGNKTLEIKNPKISKGTAAASWYKQGYNFIMAIGDDVTDEDLFASLPPSSYGIKVGHGKTVANYRLASYKDVLGLLKKLT